MLKFSNGAHTGPALVAEFSKFTSLAKLERYSKNSNATKGAKITLGNGFFRSSSITVVPMKVRGRVLSKNILFQY